MNNHIRRKIIVTGDWDGEKIWRFQTPEEMLEENGINQKIAPLALHVLGNRHLTKLKLIKNGK